jgi:hypothetical protein
MTLPANDTNVHAEQYQVLHQAVQELRTILSTLTIEKLRSQI